MVAYDDSVNDASVNDAMLAARRAVVIARSLALAALATCAAGAASSPDYAREDRWAREVEPSVVVGEALYLATPSRPRVLALLAEAPSPRGGAVIVHGLGLHPDWGLIGAMRSGLAEAGFTTLSVQMPVLAANARREDYDALFPLAGERLAAAIASLKRRGIERIAIVAHSLGAAMSDAYLASPVAERIDAWVVIGMGVDFALPLRQPVLDVEAQFELPQVRETASLRAAHLPRDACSGRIVIPGADHYMENRHKELVTAIAPFLARTFAERC